jgi:uncharacterized membrane protein YqhA
MAAQDSIFERRQGADATNPPVAPKRRSLEARFEQILAASLHTVIVPVAILVLAALGAFAYATLVFIHSIVAVVEHPLPVGGQIGLFLLDIDLFLIGATLLLSGIGFYELFIGDIQSDHDKPMPAWLQMHDLNDLKARVIGMLVMVVSVNFVETVVDAPSGRYALELGAGIAAVIVALTVFLSFSGHGSESTGEHHDT